LQLRRERDGGRRIRPARRQSRLRLERNAQQRRIQGRDDPAVQVGRSLLQEPDQGNEAAGQVLAVGMAECGDALARKQGECHDLGEDEREHEQAGEPPGQALRPKPHSRVTSPAKL
jgi:hypothetical protein